METVSAHEIETEVAGPPPRAARLPGRTQALLLLGGVLALLLVLGGGRALVEAGRLAWIATCGRPAVAQVTAVQTASGAEVGVTPPQIGLTYQYADPATGGHVSRHIALPPTLRDPDGMMPGGGLQRQSPPPARLRVGERLAIRVVGGPGHATAYFWTPAPWGEGLFLTFCGLAVMGVGLRLMLQLQRWRSFRVRLLVSGQAVTGTVIHKRVETGDAPRYHVRFGYATVGAVQTYEREEQVCMDQWKRFEVGQPVTVLYDPEAPVTAALYALMKDA